MKLRHAFADQYRGRFEAWNAQIDQFLGSLPERRRSSRPVRRLLAQRRRVRSELFRREPQRPEVEREWRRLRRTWLETLDDL